MKMSRSYALSLGTIAMSLVLVRGALRREFVDEVAVESMIALVLFAVIGGLAGAIADYLVRDDLERQYRRRVAWYCEQHEQHEAKRKQSRG